MMDIDTILTGDLTPFDFHVEEEIQELLEDKNYNIFIPVKLFCAYFEKLARKDIDLHFQSVHILDIKLDNTIKRTYRDCLVNVMENIGEELWGSFINWSSFQKEFIDLSVAGLRQITRKSYIISLLKSMNALSWRSILWNSLLQRSGLKVM